MIIQANAISIQLLVIQHYVLRGQSGLTGQFARERAAKEKSNVAEHANLAIRARVTT